MPQQLSQKPVTTFIKGLVTEAGELTFPADASVEEYNCDLRRDGSRRRRKGADRETSPTLSTFTISDTEVVGTGTWENVGGQSGLEYLVVQKGATLYFYNKATAPYSAQIAAGTVDLTTYQAVGALDAGSTICQFTSVNGTLVVASGAINTFYITRDNDLNTIAVSQIEFRVRDFDWQGDTTTYDTANGSPSVSRQYDARNVGWGQGGGPADYTKALTLPWYAGKDASGAYDAAEWAKIYSGTSLIGNGAFILDFFNKDRGTVSGLAISAEVETSRFTSVETFGGRIFYGGLDSSENSNTILFSRLTETVSEIGECLQRNDPTSEDLSDLLDTDGGLIRVSNAVGIKRLYSIGSSLLIFAENGVWSINGVDGVFRASEFSIKKVSEIGIASAQSFIAADGTPVWWSHQGIHTLSFDSVSGSASEDTISLTTIQTFWDAIPTDSKASVTATYDRINKRAYWSWPSSGETVTAKKNEFLVLDITLKAFYPWIISDEVAATDCIVGMVFYTGVGAGDIEFNVIDSLGNEVVTSAGDDVISTQLSNLSTGTSSPSIVLLIRDGATNKLTMGGFVNADFLDWGSADFSSYAIAGYEFFGDMTTKKNSPYITTYMRVTETGWSGNEAIGYVPVGESSCKVSAFWDFKTTPSSTAQEMYRLKTIPIIDTAASATFGYPETVVTTRLKLRGRGRSVRLKFESTSGKDFVLLGYAMIGAGNGKF